MQVRYNFNTHDVGEHKSSHSLKHQALIRPRPKELAFDGHHGRLGPR